MVPRPSRCRRGPSRAAARSASSSARRSPPPAAAPRRSSQPPARSPPAACRRAGGRSRGPPRGPARCRGWGPGGEERFEDPRPHLGRHPLAGHLRLPGLRRNGGRRPGRRAALAGLADHRLRREVAALHVAVEGSDLRHPALPVEQQQRADGWVGGEVRGGVGFEVEVFDGAEPLEVDHLRLEEAADLAGQRLGRCRLRAVMLARTASSAYLIASPPSSATGPRASARKSATSWPRRLRSTTGVTRGSPSVRRGPW